MIDLAKVSSHQILSLWKNVSVGLFALLAVIVISNLLPFYFAPIVSLLGASFLFTILYNSKTRRSSSCMIVPYAIFFCLINYSFLSILINVLYIWGWVRLPDEFIFFNDPYIPTLWMNPVGFLTLGVIYLRRRRLRLCIDCRMINGSHTARGVYGSIVDTEKRFQLKNLTIFAGILTVVVWTYYLIAYQSINTNGKDKYIFFWITIIAIVLDILYFFFRYYNLYLDLKENNELITPEELQDMTAKTYLRFYVICGNKVFLNKDLPDLSNPTHSGLDTPFFTNRSVNGITTPEVKQIIKEMTGGKEGSLRFFFGRRKPDLEKHSLLRYFYFLDGEPEDYPDMPLEGEWMDFEQVKLIYSKAPNLMGTLAVNDLTRLATIIVTEKTYHEDGNRKVKLKSYKPSFDLQDVRESKLNFQDDKWVKVAVFNADTRFFKLRKKINSFLNKAAKYGMK